MTDKTELRMNLAAVKRVDPYAKDIVDSSAHVAFYTFNSDENEWEKTDVEGVFFIYSRNAEPLHSIFINNRLNTNSFIEPITGQLELQAQSPFLLYRNERSRIRGFWFYNSSECDRIGELVARLIKECETAKLSTAKNCEVTRTNTNNVNIFTMLSKAQEDFNNLKNPAGTTTVTTSTTTLSTGTTNNQLDVTSQSVMNFFAAAKPAAASEVPLFKRLMSKPVSVDQIEKQQRATTPQDGKNSPPSSILHNIANLNQQQPPVTKSVVAIESALNLISSKSFQNNQDLGTSPLAKFLGTSTAPSIFPVISGNQQQQTPQQHHQARTLSASEVGNSQKQQQQPVQHLLRKDSVGQILNSSKPALMPPTMFLSSSSSTITTSLKDPITTTSIQRQLSLNNSNVSGICDSGGPLNMSSSFSSTIISGSLPRPEPLTQTQLTQAMLYLIQNDSDFVKKLHEAYLKSFTEMISI